MKAHAHNNCTTDATTAATLEKILVHDISTMAKGKGKQCGSFQSKLQKAQWLNIINGDYAAEALQYRNPISNKNILGKGHGYRNTSLPNADTTNGWNVNGRSTGGGKWSSVFSSSRPSGTSTHVVSSNRNIARGLLHLRHLLEDRRSEDRVHDRSYRLSIQRSRIREAHLGHADNTNRTNNGMITSGGEPHSATDPTLHRDRHEPGWLLSHSDNTSSRRRNNCIEDTDTIEYDAQHCDSMHQSAVLNSNHIRVPSLQLLAAKALGPLLPVYVAACGHEFVGDCLKAVSARVLSELSISLSSCTSASNIEASVFPTTDGVVKALVHSGLATGLSLRGSPLLPLAVNISSGKEGTEEEEDDTRWLSDRGLLALRPRLLPQNEHSQLNTERESSTDDEDNDEDCWEELDVDFDLTARMVGCFHLKRLELIDIPLYCPQSTQGGVSLGALRSIIQSCPGITHLSLSGCFHNWEDYGSTPLYDESEDISNLLCGCDVGLSTYQSLSTLFRPSDQHIMSLLGQCNHNYHIEKKSDVDCLVSLLAELEVLDVSHCSWISPINIFQFLLQCRERVHRTYFGRNATYDSDWDSGFVNAKNNGIDADLVIDGRIDTTLRHLNVRGCIVSPLELQIIQQWTRKCLFGGIQLSTEQQTRSDTNHQL
jgi:hypothetical protein